MNEVRKRRPFSAQLRIFFFFFFICFFFFFRFVCRPMIYRAIVYPFISLFFFFFFFFSFWLSFAHDRRFGFQLGTENAVGRGRPYRIATIGPSQFRYR